MTPEIRAMLTAKAPDAVEIIIKHMSDGDPRVSLKACELLLDRAYGKPTQAITGEQGEPGLLDPIAALMNEISGKTRTI